MSYLRREEMHWRNYPKSKIIKYQNDCTISSVRSVKFSILLH